MIRIAALVLVLAACTASQPAQAPVQASPTAPVHTFAGGCAGTVLTDSESPPAWAQGGWSHVNGTPRPVPWAIGKPGEAVAFVFATQLVAGASPRTNGSANKVLWVAKDGSVANFTVVGRPLGEHQPVVSVAGGPSIVDVPTPGCWTFLSSWGPAPQHTSTINLEVLPAGTLHSPGV